MRKNTSIRKRRFGAVCESSFASRRVVSLTTSQRFKAFAIDTAPQAADDAHPVN
jgi:hypothetical protein